jgi:predicted N-formylglutamate amidohydrolase
MPPHLLLTCEHGGRSVPRRYRECFRDAQSVLASHRGYDIGALGLARWLARQTSAPLLAARVTRLLVDLNRSCGHPRCLSDYVAGLAPDEQQRLFSDHYWPHRSAVQRAICELRGGGAGVLHVAVHSFAPVLAGEVRSADVGLLYDPARRWERRIALRWRDALRSGGAWRVRSNYPYRGTSDGLTTALRRAHPPRAYAGIELEVNQRFWAQARASRPALYRALAAALREAIAGS